MKKVFFSLLFIVATIMAAQAQKFALIDMEFILKQIPSYEQANKQMEDLSKQWQTEIEAKSNEAKALYESYQKTASTMSAEQRTAKEEEIIAKEREAAELRQTYFGPQGEAMKKRQGSPNNANRPNLTEEAVKSRLSATGNFSVNFRKSSGEGRTKKNVAYVRNRQRLNVKSLNAKDTNGGKKMLAVIAKGVIGKINAVRRPGRNGRLTKRRIKPVGICGIYATDVQTIAMGAGAA